MHTSFEEPLNWPSTSFCRKIVTIFTSFQVARSANAAPAASVRAVTAAGQDAAVPVALTAPAPNVTARLTALVDPVSWRLLHIEAASKWQTIVSSSDCMACFPAWMSNYIHDIVWDEITYPSPNFNDCTVEVWGWISNLVTHFTEHFMTYPCSAGALIHVDKMRLKIIVPTFATKWNATLGCDNSMMWCKNSNPSNGRQVVTCTYLVISSADPRWWHGITFIPGTCGYKETGKCNCGRGCHCCKCHCHCCDCCEGK